MKTFEMIQALANRDFSTIFNSGLSIEAVRKNAENYLWMAKDVVDPNAILFAETAAEQLNDYEEYLRAHEQEAI